VPQRRLTIREAAARARLPVLQCPQFHAAAALVQQFHVDAVAVLRQRLDVLTLTHLCWLHRAADAEVILGILAPPFVRRGHGSCELELYTAALSVMNRSAFRCWLIDGDTPDGEEAAGPNQDRL